jgi:hypothetical protein
MKHLCFFFVFILIGISCNRGKRNDTFSIQGKFVNSKGEKVQFCEMDVNEIVVLDSASITTKGTVNFSHPADQPGFYLLIFPDGRRITLLMNAGEEVILKEDLESGQENLTVAGSAGSVLLENFFHSTQKNKQRIDSVKRNLLRDEGSEDFLRTGMRADSLFYRINEDQKKLEKEFIENNKTSLASLIVLNYSFGPRPVLTLESDLDDYLKLTGLCRYYPKNKHVLYHMKRVSLFLNMLKEQGK